MKVVDGLATKVYEFGGGLVKEHLGGIYEFLQKKKIDSLNELQKAEKKAKQNVTEIRKDMPVEQIYSLLTRDSAAAVVIPTKYYHGMTLGQLAIEKPQALEWYVTSYGGPDNLLRAAARFLLDTALKQAG